MVHVNYKSPMNHLVFLIKAQKRGGKNMTLPRFESVIQTNMFMPWAVSFQNSIKAALEVGGFQWEIQFDVTSIHILQCRDLRYSISFFCQG